MSIIDDYINFDADRFCREYPQKVADLAIMEQHKEDAIDETAGDPSSERVQHSRNIASDVEKRVIRRALFDSRIESLREYIETYRFAISTLTEEERTVIDLFYNSKKSSTSAVVALEMSYGISRSSAYRIKNTALAKIANAVIIRLS